MLTRKPRMLVVVELANKTARIIWALMAHGGSYRASGRGRVTNGQGQRRRGCSKVNRRFGETFDDPGRENQKRPKRVDRGRPTWT